MIARMMEIIRYRLGWCPYAQTMRTSSSVHSLPKITIQPPQPADRAGGSGRIDRGFNVFFGSIRILIRNRQLFWFSFLIGLVLLFSLVTTIALQFFSGTDPLTGGSLATGSTALIVKGSPAWAALTFASGLIAAFCTLCLMTALIACVSLLFSGRTTTIREGLTSAGSHLGSITGWAVVFAIMGTAQPVILNRYPGNFSLVIISGIIIVFLYLATFFVIPILVFEDKSLIGAIAGSLALFRRTWGEILLCCFFFGLLFFAVAFVSLLPVAIIGFPSGNTLFLGITVALFEFVLLVAIVIGTTVIGILTIGLYSFAKTGRLPGMFEEKERVRASL